MHEHCGCYWWLYKFTRAFIINITMYIINALNNRVEILYTNSLKKKIVVVFFYVIVS